MNRALGLAREQETFAAVLQDADLDLPVSSCGSWRVRDLGSHLGGVHRWATAMTRVPPDGDGLDDAEELWGAPAGADLVDFYVCAAQDLRQELTAHPTRPCLTLAGPGVAGDWTRRQLHETFVHRLDLQSALGLDAPVDPDVAADCVAEVVDTMFPRQVRLGRTPSPSVGVELGGRWVLGSQDVVASVEADPADLALLLWGRVRLDDPRFTVGGDLRAARDLLAGRTTP